MRCREEELSKAQVQQKQQEENLRQREQELAAREIDLLERELTVMIIQQQTVPTPNMRKGKFKKSRLKLNKKEPGSNISAPSGTLLIVIVVVIITYLICFVKLSLLTVRIRDHINNNTKFT